MKQLVRVTTTLDHNERPYFISENVKPGDVIYFSYSEIVNRKLWHKPMKIIYETPFHFRVDMGPYKMSINKASVYCNKEVLYFYC